MNYIYYELNEYSSISNTIKISDKTKFNSNLIVYVLVIYLQLKDFLVITDNAYNKEELI